MISEYWIRIRRRVPVCVYTVFKTLSWKHTAMKYQMQFHNSFGAFVHWLSDIYFPIFNAFLWIFKSFNYKKLVHRNRIFFFQEHNKKIFLEHVQKSKNCVCTSSYPEPKFFKNSKLIRSSSKIPIKNFLMKKYFVDSVF